MFMLVNKPVGITSAHYLNKIKKTFPKGTKVGHAGTLDVFASGLLVVGVGRAATKQLHSIMQMDKRYVATGQLGIETDTLDSRGTIIKQRKLPSYPTKEALAAVLNSFTPSYEQVPPLYSALKYKGKRLSDLARSKQFAAPTLDRLAQQKTRLVHVYSLKLTTFSPPCFTLEAQVSCGTYIRSLIRDIGIQLGNYATTTELCRTAIGHFLLKDANSF